MGKMFSKISTDGVEKQEDRVGGGYEAHATGIYEGTVKNAFVTTSAEGATAVNLILDLAGKELRTQEWILNKSGENFFYDKNDKTKKILLPSFSSIDDLCLLTTEEGLTEQDTEEKIVKIWNSQERKEVNTPVPVLIDLIGKPVKVAVLRTISFKQVKGDSGRYEDTAETRTENSIEKFMHPETSMTVNEYRHEVGEAEFHDAWLKANTTAEGVGKDRDKTKGKPGAGAGSTGTGRPGAAGTSGEAAPKKSMFAKK